MSIKVKVDLTEFDETKPKIMKAIKKGLKKAGLIIERDAKIFAPVRTSRLRSSIHTTQEGFKAIIQDNVHYGIHQEYGTRFMKAHPFMKPSVNKNILAISRAIVNEVKRVLR